MKAPHLFRIGEWAIDTGRCVAARGGEEVRLEPKTVELLAYLASRSGRVVSRTELLDAVWPGMVVGEEAITNAVAKLRKALGDDSRTGRLIETIPKRGYRVVTEALVDRNEPVSADAKPSRAAALITLLVVAALVGLFFAIQTGDLEETVTSQQETPSLPDRPSVSVLPFVNLSDDPAQEYFADGLTEDLITDLSRVSSLFVIARNSSFGYKNRSVDVRQVARELGVRYLVEGNVRKVADRLRVNVKLVDASSGEQLWGERFDGHLSELFDFQETLTDGIADALAVDRTRFEKDYGAFRETHAPDAYENYLKGSVEYLAGTPESLRRAIAHLERALEVDPGYGRALATLAAVYWEIYRNRWHRRLGISPNTAVWQKADDYLARSMIAPTALAHKVASEMLTFNRRYEQALSEAELAIALEPNAPQGYVALAEVKTFMGSPVEALSLLDQAIRLDPRGNPSYLFALGKAQLAMGRAAEAAATFRKAVDGNQDSRLAWMGLLSAYGTLGESERAAETLAGLEALQVRDQMLSFLVAGSRELWPFQHDVDREAFLDGLRKAGVREW